MNELEIKDNIETMIYEIRGKQVMLANDVANLYNVETKALNQTIKRNIKRFPESFCFQLQENEWKILRSQIFTSKQKRGGNRYLPYVLTEQGVMMLSGLLKSDVAAIINVRIINAFVAMKKYISSNLLEQRYIMTKFGEYEERLKILEETFNKFKTTNEEIFFKGQIYDAYSKIVDIMKEAKKELILIDAYADKITLDMISQVKCKVKLICKNKTLLKQLDIEKYNEQYDNLKIYYTDNYHDRYIIIDKKTIYHCGTSLNHIGSKTFSINKIEDKIIIKSLIENIKSIIK